MPWSDFWSSSTKGQPSRNEQTQAVTTSTTESLQAKASAIATNLREDATEIVDNITSTKPSDLATSDDLAASFTSPSTLISTAILTTTLLTLFALQRRFLRRIPTATAVPQAYILPSTRRFSRSIFGQVTSVGDADNFRLFHTPFGRLAFWGSLRRIPSDPKTLKHNTIHIRLAGIDAPELAHFGKPAQPYGKEALDWLTAYLRGRRVRCYLHKADQYSRVVATVYVRKWLFRRDVGLQMLKAGLATVYEAKSGAEFGGEGIEEQYRKAEQDAKAKKRGMWKDEKMETPREYKNRYREGSG